MKDANVKSFVKRTVTAKKETLKDKVFFWKGVPVCTTKQLAEFYECQTQQITQIFNNNKVRFKEEQDYVKITGVLIKEFIEENSWNDVAIDVSVSANVLYLWKIKGCLKFSVVLTTDVAWEVYTKSADLFDVFGFLRKSEQLSKEEIKDELYVILFDNDVIKVGRSKKAVQRVSQHYETAAAFGRRIIKFCIEQNPDVSEIDLINFCRSNGVLFFGNEYFKGVGYDSVVAFMKAKKIKRKLILVK